MWSSLRRPVARPWPRFLFAAGLLISLLAIPTVRSQNSGIFRGVVTDRFDAAISDALLSLFSTDRVLQVKSDRSGRFEFANVPSGTYKLEVSTAGFQTRTFDPISIPQMDAEVMAITLTIENPGSDCGRGAAPTYEKLALTKSALIGIVRNSGGPVGEFKILLLKVGTARVLASQHSNEKGEFHFRDVEPGQYFVRASRKNWTAQSEICWITRENTARIILDPVKRGSVILCQ